MHASLCKSDIVYRQIQMTSPTSVVLLGHDTEGCTDVLTLMEQKTTILTKVVEPSRLLYTSDQNNRTILVCASGVALYVEPELELQDMELELQTPSALALKVINKHPVLFSINSNHQLYANDNLLSTTATSLALHQDYLIYTTVEHTARFMSFEHCLRVTPGSDAPRFIL